MSKVEGLYTAEGLKVAIVTARFNEVITYKLTEGSVDCLLRHGAKKEDILEVLVPGAYEIPVVAKKLAASGKYDAIICNGAVIKGDTPHFDTVVNAVNSGVNQVGLEFGLPVIFGVLTTNTVDQAFDRAGIKAGNKGWEAALTAIETVNVLKQL